MQLDESANVVVITESSSKVSAIKSFIQNSKVFATKGHFKDLPKKKDIGINLTTYEPVFEYTSKQAQTMIQNLKKECAGAIVYIAMEPNREGYAIAKMVYDEIKITAQKIYRAEFQELTKSGVIDGLNRAIEFRLTNPGGFDAYLGRRIGDRMIGWIMSPKAKKAIAKDKDWKVSVGRLQTAAVKLSVDKEREILAFLSKPEADRHFYHVAIEVDIIGETIKFSSADAFGALDADKITNSLGEFKKATILDVERSILNIDRPMPYTTSDLLNNASKKLKLDAKSATAAAQKLFEAGLITFMQVDSRRLSEDFINFATEQVQREFECASSAKQHEDHGTQHEAHEAIRPSNWAISKIASGTTISCYIDNAVAENGLNSSEEGLLRLIYATAFASQAEDGENIVYKYKLEVGGYEFVTLKAHPIKLGFRQVLATITKKQIKMGDKALPVRKGDVVEIQHVSVEKIKKERPKRFDEGDLIKELENRGIGRPSSYPNTMDTIKANKYCIPDEKGKMAPTELAFALIEHLEKTDPWILEYDFTAKMESFLDDVQNGKKEYKDFCRILHEKMGFERPSGGTIFPPTKKQIAAAEKLSKRLSVSIPEESMKSSSALSSWIEWAISVLSSGDNTGNEGSGGGAKISISPTTTSVDDHGESDNVSPHQRRGGRLSTAGEVRPPSAKQIFLVRKKAEQLGIVVSEDILEDAEKTRAWLDRNLT